MPRPPRPCLDCGQLTAASRCVTCTTQRNRARNARRTHYHGTWQTTSAGARAEWIEANGHVCPGHGRPAHPAVDLTLDHTTGKVLCLRCNVNAGPANA